MNTQTTSSIESELELAFEKWRDCQDLDTPTLLRLVVLREMIHLLHAEKSRCLACGKRQEAQALRVLEERLEALRDQPTLDGDIRQWCFSDKPIPAGRRHRLVPDNLVTRIGRDKFDRYDRKWESAIAAEAAQAGWGFWTLEAWVEVSQVEPWAALLTQRLWPHGLILFVENACNPSIMERYWQGRWYVALAPHYRHPDELALQLERWTGSGSSSDPGMAPPRWSVVLGTQGRKR